MPSANFPVPKFVKLTDQTLEYVTITRHIQVARVPTAKLAELWRPGIFNPVANSSALLRPPDGKDALVGPQYSITNRATFICPFADTRCSSQYIRLGGHALLSASCVGTR